MTPRLDIASRILASMHVNPHGHDISGLWAEYALEQTDVLIKLCGEIELSKSVDITTDRPRIKGRSIWVARHQVESSVSADWWAVYNKKPECVESIEFVQVIE